MTETTPTKPPRLNRHARDAQRTIDKAVRHKSRRDAEDTELQKLKEAAIAEAEEKGLSSMTKIAPKTGDQVIVCCTRQGSPIEEEEIARLSALLTDTPELLDRLFPRYEIRRYDYEAISGFLQQEWPAGSAEKIAQGEIVAAVKQRTKWTYKILPPKRRRCIICGGEMSFTESPFNVCQTHRDLFRWPQLVAAYAKEEVSPAKFNTRSERRSREVWLKPDRLAAYEQAIGSRPRRRKSDADPEPEPVATE
jgi:hypothetical protein